MNVIGVEKNSKKIMSLNLVRDVCSISTEKRRVIFLTRLGTFYQIVSLKELAAYCKPLGFEQFNKSYFVNLRKISDVNSEVSDYKNSGSVWVNAYLQDISDAIHLARDRFSGITDLVQQKPWVASPNEDMPISLMAIDPDGMRRVYEFDLLQDIAYIKRVDSHLVFYTTRNPDMPYRQLGILGEYENIMKDHFFAPDPINLVNIHLIKNIHAKKRENVIHFVGCEDVTAVMSMHYLEKNYEQYAHLIIKD